MTTWIKDVVKLAQNAIAWAYSLVMKDRSQTEEIETIEEIATLTVTQTKKSTYRRLNSTGERLEDQSQC